MHCHGKMGGNGRKGATKRMKSSVNVKTRKTCAAINPHLPMILVSPPTLASTHHLIDCKADQYFESATVTTAASQVARESHCFTLLKEHSNQVD